MYKPNVDILFGNDFIESMRELSRVIFEITKHFKVLSVVAQSHYNYPEKKYDDGLAWGEIEQGKFSKMQEYRIKKL